MPLKNKDGSPYRLLFPNPLVKTQEWINAEDLEFHNFFWTPIDIEATAEPDPEPETEPETEMETEMEPKQITEIPVPVSPKPIEKTQNNVIVHCLPVEWVEKRDGMYGENYKTKKYGQKFTFEAVVVERGDLAISIWTSANLEEHIKPGSIIFPSFGDYRWWAVNKVNAYNGGVLIVAVLTDAHPSF